MVDLVNATQERGHCSRIYKDSSTRQGSGFFLRKHAIFSSPPSLQNDRNDPKKSVGTRQQRHWCTRSVKQATLHNPMFSFDQPAFSLDGLMFSYKCFPTFSHHWNCNFCHDLQLQTLKVRCFFLSVSCGFLLSLDLKDFLRFSSGGSCLFLTCSFVSLDLDLGCCLDFLPCSEMSFLSAYFEFLLISEEEKRDKQCQGKG